MKEDYCTAFPEGWWAHCCANHDKAYTLQTGKVEADVQLFKCVADSGYAVPSFLIAALMFVAVSTFGFMFYKKKK